MQICSGNLSLAEPNLRALQVHIELLSFAKNRWGGKNKQCNAKTKAYRINKKYKNAVLSHLSTEKFDNLFFRE